MKEFLEITNLTKRKIDKIFLRRVARVAVKETGQKEISLVLVGENKIKEINRKYRHKNKPTDVLSFEDLNEIFICPEIVKKQAKNLKAPAKNELARVLIHGILHLAGYEHEKSKKEAEEMRKKEEEILTRIL
jgi:probable rRNA maturation factor